LVKQIADEFSDEKSTHRKKKQKMLLWNTQISFFTKG
jgi:hypothetical protein